MAGGKSIYSGNKILMQALPSRKNPDYQEKRIAAFLALAEFHGVEYEPDNELFDKREFVDAVLSALLRSHVPAFRRPGRKNTRPLEYKARRKLLEEVEKLKQSDKSACDNIRKRWLKDSTQNPYTTQKLSVPKLKSDLAIARKERANGIDLGEDHCWDLKMTVNKSSGEFNLALVAKKQPLNF